MLSLLLFRFRERVETFAAKYEFAVFFALKTTPVIMYFRIMKHSVVNLSGLRESLL